MSLQFKLVGTKNMNKKVLVYTILEDDKIYSFNIKDIYDFIIALFEKNLTKEEIQSDLHHFKLIYNGNPIKDPDKSYVVQKGTINSIYVFTSDIDKREKYNKLWDEHGNIIDNNMNVNIINKNSDSKKKEVLDDKYKQELPDTDYVLTAEEILDSNSDVVKIFEEKDFITLLNIYKNKPYLFDYLSQYVSTGNIIDLDNIETENAINNSENENSESDVFIHEESLKKINDILSSLNINPDEKLIKCLLIKYNGFINIPLRAILYNSCQSNEKKN